jgi:hypothetical protein
MLLLTGRSRAQHGVNYGTALALKLAAKAYYNCAESAGANFTDSKGGLDLTQSNAPGASGGYRTFATASSQKGERASSAALQAAGDFGVFGWVKVTSHVDYAGLVTKYDGGAGQAEFGLYIPTGTNAIRFALMTAGGLPTDQIDSLVNVEDGAAHSFAAWVTGATMYLKVDAEATVNAGFAGSTVGRTAPFRFGSLDGAGFFLDGALRMIGYFSTGFSAAQITYLKNGGSGKTWAQIVADAA